MNIRDYRRLCNEIMRLMLTNELFVFVTETGAAGNNNAAERELRDSAMARKTGRTSKTPSGAKRRRVIASVLQSIGKQLKTFTLGAVIDEVNAWVKRGRSRFSDQVRAHGLDPPVINSYLASPSLLDRLILNADS